MKTLLLLLLFSLPLRADDLFRADGKQSVVRSLPRGGKTLLSVQLGNRTAEGLIEVYHKGGMTLCAPRELPELWLAALARREAEGLAPGGEKKKSATIQAAEKESAYRKKMGECLAAATVRLTKPAPLFETKADGSVFSGELLALKAGEILITDGNAVAWVPDSYFKAPAEIRALADVKSSPETHAAARKLADERAWEKGRKEWPDDYSMQEYVHRRQMESWDRQYPAPGKTSRRAAAAGPDPFAK